MTTSSLKLAAKTKHQGPVRPSVAKDFLAKYKKAWETRDADLAASLFTRDAPVKRRAWNC